MLLRENLKQTMRLLLLNVFVINESVLTFLIHFIYDRCSSFFESLLFKFEQEELNENESELWIVSNPQHKRFSAIDRLKSKYCRDIFHLSTKTSVDDRIMSVEFKIAFRTAYLDYDMSYIMHFDISVIQWCKKLTFYDLISDRRVSLAMNDFVEFDDQDNFDNRKMIRLDHLFVHELNSARRLFANIFRIFRNDSNARDEILDVSLLRYAKRST